LDYPGIEQQWHWLQRKDRGGAHKTLGVVGFTECLSLDFKLCVDEVISKLQKYPSIL
jgi:hypothetical protein